jgi:hypothetical protein
VGRPDQAAARRSSEQLHCTQHARPHLLLECDGRGCSSSKQSSGADLPQPLGMPRADGRGAASSEQLHHAAVSQPPRLPQGDGRGCASTEQPPRAHVPRSPRLQRDGSWRAGAPQHHRHHRVPEPAHRILCVAPLHGSPPKCCIGLSAHQTPCSHRSVLHPHARTVTGRVRLTPSRHLALSPCPLRLHDPCRGREGALHACSHPRLLAGGVWRTEGGHTRAPSPKKVFRQKQRSNLRPSTHTSFRDCSGLVMATILSSHLRSAIPCARCAHSDLAAGAGSHAEVAASDRAHVAAGALQAAEAHGEPCNTIQ